MFMHDFQSQHPILFLCIKFAEHKFYYLWCHLPCLTCRFLNFSLLQLIPMFLNYGKYISRYAHIFLILILYYCKPYWAFVVTSTHIYLNISMMLKNLRVFYLIVQYLNGGCLHNSSIFEWCSEDPTFQFPNK